MRQPGINSNRTDVAVLSISPIEDDHLSLRTIFRHCKWALFTADHLVAAWSLLQKHNISVIVCECDLKAGKWTDVLDHTKDFLHPPPLIITSRVADERLWAEALNWGCWDVLAKPSDRTEVLRVVRAAWQHCLLENSKAGRTYSCNT
jgi:DNA-binding NtrC family response regulator